MFQKAGSHNTDEAIKLAVAAAKEHNISHIVAASTVGSTAKAALDAIQSTGLKLVVVAHSSSFANAGVQEFDAELRKQIESAGHCVYTGTHLFRGIGRAVKNRAGSSDEEIVANSLRIFGQGMKVAVEIVAMAVDAGLVPHPSNVISIAGTGRGADTVILAGTAPSHAFFDLKVRKIIAKPFEF